MITNNRTPKHSMIALWSQNFLLCSICAFFLLYISTANGAYPRETIVRTPLEILSLYTPALLRPVLSKAKISQECLVGFNQSQQKLCQSKMIREATRELRISVYERPSLESPVLGKILVRSIPLEELKFYYLDSAHGKETPFTPDISCKFSDSDCVAEHSVLDRQKDWIQLPANPFPGAVWINFKKDLQIEPRVRSLAKLGRLFTVGRAVRATLLPQGKNDFIQSGSEVFLKRIEQGRLVVRMGLPGDRECRPKDFPLGQDPQEYAIAFGELYSGTGQIRLSPTYPNYCPEKKESGLPLYKP